MDPIVYKNVLAWRGCEKLYLKSRSSDVSFIFRSEEIEKVSAHKCILSAISPVFDAMFYGLHKQDGDIDVVDATPEAFKEFLQFFYCSEVKLSAENLPGVMDLCRRYLLDDWRTISMACTKLCESTLTLDNMCWGYELAILFELDELKTFCEKRIGENPAEIFHSSSFLNCQPNLLGHILHLDSLKCAESIVFDGCMEWAVAECVRKKCDEINAQNLRSQLGALFYEIRFGEMALKEFQDRYLLYDGLFSLDEYRDITMMIGCKDFRPKNFNRCPRKHERVETIEASKNYNYIVCNIPNNSRWNSWQNVLHFIDGETIEKSTKFTSSSKLCLKRISCAAGYVTNDRNAITEVKIRIFKNCTEQIRGILTTSVQASLNGRSSTVIDLPAEIKIEPGVIYDINIEVNRNAKFSSIKSTKKTIEMEDGTIIDFLYNSRHTAKKNEPHDCLVTIIDALHFVE